MRRARLPWLLGLAMIAAGSAPARAQAPDAGSAGSAAGSAGSAGSATVIQLPVDVMAPEVNASASPTVVTLGGRFTLFVTATFGPGVEVNLPEPLDLGPGFEVTHKLSEDRPRADGKRTREWQIDVTAWDLGEVRLAPIAVTYTVAGRAGQVLTAAIKLRIEGVLGEAVDEASALRGLQPPAPLLARDHRWLWIAGGVGALILVGGALLAWRRRRRIVRLVGGAVARPRDLDMTGERALEALLAIEASGELTRAEDRKGGYAAMVEVLRAYLAARYRVAIHDLTSSELLRRLAAVAPADELALVEGWLARCDLVKYGGLAATSDDARGALDDARALVVTTTTLRHAPAREVAA